MYTILAYQILSLQVNEMIHSFIPLDVLVEEHYYNSPQLKLYGDSFLSPNPTKLIKKKLLAECQFRHLFSFLTLDHSLSSCQFRHLFSMLTLDHSLSSLYWFPSPAIIHNKNY